MRRLIFASGIAPLILTLTAGAQPPAAPASAAAPSSSEIAAMMAELQLEESSTAARERPSWRPPRMVIVPQFSPQQIDGLRASAPGVELIVAQDMADALAAAPRADAAIGFCSEALLARGQQLRWLQLLNAGVEQCVSLQGLQQRDILLTNMQRVAGPIIAEHVMAMMLSLARALPTYMRHQMQPEWNRTPGEDGSMISLQDKTLLIAGLGGIGTEVARRAHTFGMRIVATRASSRAAPDFVTEVGPPSRLTTLARTADVIVNTLPLTEQTAGVFDARLFAAVKPGALFINVGRGGTVVTSALVEALQAKRLGGAGLDVTDPEPLPADHPLWRTPNVIITPHVAAHSDLGNDRVWQVVRENLRRYAAGERMLSVVDIHRGY